MSADPYRRSAVPIRNSVFNPATPSRPRPTPSVSFTQNSNRSTDDNNVNSSNVQSGFSLRRQKSLIRPDRERIDSNHPYYHYYAHASELAEDRIANSQTGNTPRRGKSVSERERPKSIKKKQHQGAVPRKKKPQRLPSCWIIFCYIVTFYAPSFLLSTCGRMKLPEVQRAWREKMGLITIILLICGAVGFITFGFTQTVCRSPPARINGGEATSGTVIVNGFAINFDDLDFQHPGFNGYQPSNPAYPPIDAGGKDASFLFQKANYNCRGLISPASGGNYFQQNDLLGWYFPCVIIGQNSVQTTVTKNFTVDACHANLDIKAQLADLIKNSAAEIFYTWEDIADPDRNLAVYNGFILDFNKLKWLDLSQVNIPQTFLTLMNPDNEYRGKDASLVFASKGEKHIADCLVDIVRVGSIDSKTMGCIASDLVLVVSLIFIVGVVLIKFILAVIFGWCISWRLGSFKPETYEERMKRAAEIEKWSENILKPAPQLKKQRNSFLPATSRFSNANFGRTGNGQAGAHQYGSYTNRRSQYLRPSSSTTSLTQGAPSTAKSSPTNSPRLLPISGSGNSSGPSSPGLPPSRSHSDLNTIALPELASVSKHGSTTSLALPKGYEAISTDSIDLHSNANTVLPDAGYQPFNFELAQTICLVTAYSESVEGLRTTLDSIATTDYPNTHKLILVIADGIIRGSGNELSTPEICLSMMKDFVIPKNKVEAHSYLAIADGTKRHNMAKVYAGFYKYDKTTVDPSKHQPVPIVTIVKCGPPEEASAPKPGNRGKRDSQLILMSFLQKVMFDERMTPLEYELFNAIWRVTGATPDKYELVLMVDADTKVYPDSLTRMISCMVQDHEIMGLCGETKIANKAHSFWTMIQVFEYYISHHSSKAFESVFGGVTCLPGCFCMYRIKTPKGPEGYWVPILANPDIVERYSENIVDTLHKKNLLLLGEDRYLSTLMLRTFPKRKMLFVPQAVCKTVVPDTFSVLLSQRRRWINSTVHNLMELVLVRDLCGTFCFSMQFVIFMELIGTVVLPAAISFTIYLIVISFIIRPIPFIPLLLLATILGLPAVLILMTSRKIVYVGWMLIYLFALPIWNFVLPVYAYWHFDDFSWGQTRQVAGEKSGRDDHGKKGEFDSSRLVMKRWADFERERRYREAIAEGLPPPVFIDDNHKLRYSVAESLDSENSSRTFESLAPLTKKVSMGRFSTPPGGGNYTEHGPPLPKGDLERQESANFQQTYYKDQAWKQVQVTSENDIELTDMSSTVSNSPTGYQQDRDLATDVPEHSSDPAIDSNPDSTVQQSSDRVEETDSSQITEYRAQNLSTPSSSDRISVYDDFYNKSPPAHNRRDAAGRGSPDSIALARGVTRQTSRESVHQQEMTQDQMSMSMLPSQPLKEEEESENVQVMSPKRYYNNYKQLRKDNSNSSSDQS
ncbi:5375_t:CDS:2 [Paraglomus occultum]|uniref:chitin synthase n=1 Tax=Paraglomus occultum TaxID=144539 RepID=A0A9N9F6A1_9GLOM|nr:5375_t:CDS:2 [Paraglomus occultum]